MKKVIQHSLSLNLPNEMATYRLGELLAKLVEPMFVFYLSGELGSGKTTFCRGFLRGQGYQGVVKSPTYTLVEPYTFTVQKRQVLHFDLYRLNAPEELEFIGIRDYLQMDSIYLIEWPEQGEGYIPMVDLWLQLTYIETQRGVLLTAYSERASKVIQQLKEIVNRDYLIWNKVVV